MRVFIVKWPCVWAHENLGSLEAKGDSGQKQEWVLPTLPAASAKRKL